LVGSLLLKAIATKRRAELFGEGHRFFHLKRIRRTMVREGTCGNTAVSVASDCRLDPAGRELALPIPEGIRNANPTITQNPGY
jgi:hypothetical protein